LVKEETSPVWLGKWIGFSFVLVTKVAGVGVILGGFMGQKLDRNNVLR
jgi:hypothetical protein